MALKQFIYEKEGCPFASCEQGKFQIEVGEKLKITLEPKNPDWASSFTADVISVTNTPTGVNYVLEYDDAVLGASGVMFEGCDIQDIAPYCCCDALDERVTVLEALVDANTTYTFGFTSDGTNITFTATDSDGAVQTFVVGDANTQDVSNFSGALNTAGDAFNITHTSGGASTTVAIPVGVQAVTTNVLANGDTQILADGVLVGVIPANPVITTNVLADGSIELLVDGTVVQTFPPDTDTNTTVTTNTLPNGDIQLIVNGVVTETFPFDVDTNTTVTTNTLPNGDIQLIVDGTVTQVFPADTDTITTVTTNTLANGDIQLIVNGAVTETFPFDNDNGNVTQVVNADGSTTSTHVPSGFFWTTFPADTDALVDNGDGTYTGAGSIASVDTRAVSNPIDNSGNNLTATNVEATVDEIATKERAFQNSGTAESATNDVGVAGTADAFRTGYTSIGADVADDGTHKLRVTGSARVSDSIGVNTAPGVGVFGDQIKLATSGGRLNGYIGGDGTDGRILIHSGDTISSVSQGAYFILFGNTYSDTRFTAGANLAIRRQAQTANTNWFQMGSGDGVVEDGTSRNDFRWGMNTRVFQIKQNNGFTSASSPSYSMYYTLPDADRNAIVANAIGTTVQLTAFKQEFYDLLVEAKVDLARYKDPRVLHFGIKIQAESRQSRFAFQNGADTYELLADIDSGEGSLYKNGKVELESPDLAWVVENYGSIPTPLKEGEGFKVRLSNTKGEEVEDVINDLDGDYIVSYKGIGTADQDEYFELNGERVEGLGSGEIKLTVKDGEASLKYLYGSKDGKNSGESMELTFTKVEAQAVKK